MCVSALEGNLNDLRSWVDIGIDPNGQNYDGATPLHMACESGNLDCVKFLAAIGIM